MGYPTSHEILARLTNLHPKKIDLSLGRMERLLARLEHPELKLPPVVHVGGTNGKGSVGAFLSAILRAADYVVDAYVSPHLVRFNERVVLGGENIDERSLANILEECEAANDGAPITFFEITTAAAFLAFSRSTADILVLEVGLGGRLDATNVLTPLLSAITPVSLDHQQFLGDTISEIAGEKAGILKPDVTAVIGPQCSAAEAPIVAKAAELGTSLLRAGHDWHVIPTPAGLQYQDFSGTTDYPKPALVGRHQIENAGIAISCAKQLAISGFEQLNNFTISRGLESAVWPGRLQQLPWPDLPPGWELWLDGGHNPAAGDALAEQATAWSDQPLHLVVGMLNTKDPNGFLAPLALRATSVTAIDIPDEQASLTGPEIIAALGRSQSDAAAACTMPDVRSAFAGIVARDQEPGRILVCGSLYLVGKVLGEAEKTGSEAAASGVAQATAM